MAEVAEAAVESAAARPAAADETADESVAAVAATPDADTDDPEATVADVAARPSAGDTAGYDIVPPVTDAPGPLRAGSRAVDAAADRGGAAERGART